MGIQYIEGFRHTNSARYAVVDIQDIYLDEENPRFASSTLITGQAEVTQSTIINYLYEYGEISALAHSIEVNHGLFNEDIASAYIKDGKVIVLEGNRRVSACKILLDNDLIDTEARLYPIPTISEKTRENIEKLNLIIYDESADAQKYIASKHTQPDIKKWTTIEQNNYYYSQFSKKKSPSEIAAEVGVKDTKKVEERIRQYILFRKIFDLVKKDSPGVHVETAHILPVVTEFMPKLLGNKNEYSLGLMADAITLEYIPLPSQREKYNQILLLIGKAFFERPEAKSSVDLDERPTNNKFRISTNEVKGKGKANKIIDDDIRIPGLKRLILEFRNEFPIDPTNAGMQSNSGENHSNNQGVDGTPVATTGDSAPASGAASSPTDKGTFDSASRDSDAESKRAFAQKEKQLSFFADLRIEHLDPADPNNQGLIAVAKEIRAISSAHSYTAYYQFPMASVFLLRSLIEQVIIRQLKKGHTYDRLASGGGKATPELGKMVNDMLKSYESKNLKDFNNDSRLAQDFNACFVGFGTKDQLDKVIHRPAECKPSKDFLDNLAKQGIKDLLQKFIDSFTPD